MLVKFVLFSSILLTSCAKEKKYFHTEISCPGKSVVLVRYTTLKEVQASIVKNNEDKKRLGTSENYTVIYASGTRSLKIPGVSPEDMYKCELREILVVTPDKNITKYE